MNGWMRLGSATILSALWCGTGSAATLLVDCPVIGPLKTELNVNLACPQFDPGAGALSSVSIELTGTITGSLSLTNNAGTTQSANATTTSDFNITSIAGTGPGASGFSWTNPIFSASFSTGLKTLNPGQTISTPGLSGTGSTTLGPDTTVLDPYKGLGSFDIAVFTLTGLSVVGGGGQIGAGQDTDAKILGKVTYTYAPIPEPSALSLIAVGTLALVALRRRRAK